MTVLTCGLHDPKAGLKWISDKHVPTLLELFDAVIITASPLTDQNYLDALEFQGCQVFRRKQNIIIQSYLNAIKHGRDTGAETILYCDFDRVMHWVRTYPKELSCVAKHIKKTGYLIGERGPREYQTHHDALYYTEQLPNAIISAHMGDKKQHDYLSGCYGFSKEAADYIVKHMKAKDFSFFGEWPAIMKRQGFKPTYLVCKGLEWETPDQHQEDVKRCGSVEAYREQLSSPTEWKRRTLMAHEFVKTIVPKP